RPDRFGSGAARPRRSIRPRHRRHRRSRASSRHRVRRPSALLTIVVRNTAKTEKTVEIRRTTGNSAVDCVIGDLSVLSACTLWLPSSGRAGTVWTFWSTTWARFSSDTPPPWTAYLVLQPLDF